VAGATEYELAHSRGPKSEFSSQKCHAQSKHGAWRGGQLCWKVMIRAYDQGSIIALRPLRGSGASGVCLELDYWRTITS
jgi:hypothetical protein